MTTSKKYIDYIEYISKNHPNWTKEFEIYGYVPTFTEIQKMKESNPNGTVSLPILKQSIKIENPTITVSIPNNIKSKKPHQIKQPQIKQPQFQQSQFQQFQQFQQPQYNQQHLQNLQLSIQMQQLQHMQLIIVLVSI